jgi:hypothetical protein
MCASVFIVRLHEFAENYFVLNLIGIYGYWGIELVNILDKKLLKMSTGCSSTEHSIFLILISCTISVT